MWWNRWSGTMQSSSQSKVTTAQTNKKWRKITKNRVAQESACFLWFKFKREAPIFLISPLNLICHGLFVTMRDLVGCDDRMHCDVMTCDQCGDGTRRFLNVLVRWLCDLVLSQAQLLPNLGPSAGRTKSHRVVRNLTSHNSRTFFFVGSSFEVGLTPMVWPLKQKEPWQLLFFERS